MKKVIYLVLMLFISTQINSQNVAVSTETNDWWPQLNQAATNLTTPDGWYYRTNVGSERLAFDGNVVPGTSIATTFGTLGAPYTGMTIKFDCTMPAPGSGKSTIIVLGSNAVWGGQGIVIEYTEFGVRAVKNFDYSAMTWIGSGSDYTTVLGAGGMIAGNEINISETGLITLKFGSFVCPTSYQADVTVLSNTFVLVCPNATGFKFKNVIATKGSQSVQYFPTPTTTSLQAPTKNSFSVYPTSGNGIFTIANAKAGQPYRILNLTGQSVEAGTIKGENHQINISNLSSGSYFIMLENNGKKSVERIVKN